MGITLLNNNCSVAANHIKGLLPNRLLLQILNFGCKLQTAPWRILAKYASSRFEIFARNLEFSSQSLLGNSPLSE